MRSTYRVFVVDDEPLIARTLAAILTDCGYDAMFFTDPLGALEVVGKGWPAFLVSDVTMPGLTGIQLAMEVRKRSPNCRIFLMSALDSIEAELKKAGAKAQEFQIFQTNLSGQTICLMPWRTDCWIVSLIVCLAVLQDSIQTRFVRNIWTACQNGLTRKHMAALKESRPGSDGCDWKSTGLDIIQIRRCDNSFRFFEDDLFSEHAR
jgi:CheY-like chemotaxis protein